MADITSEQAYEKWYDTFMAIPEDEVVYCNTPVEVASAEGRALAAAATLHRAVLISWGLAPELVDTLRERIEAYTYAAAKHENSLNVDPQALSEWKEKSPRGYEVQKELTRTMSFGFRKDKRLSQIMADIRQGQGHQDMINDNMRLSVLAKDNPEPLKKMPAFNFSLVEEAHALYGSLGEIFARSNVNPSVVEATKTAMNRAWTFYKMAADEVIETGRFAFEGTDEYNNYVSEYRQKLGKKAAKTAAAAAATATAAASSEDTPKSEAV